MRNIIQHLLNNGFIKEETIGFDQITKHLQRAEKDLVVAEANLSIDAEAAYNYAYLAMLRSGRALIFSFGYRPIDGCQHKTIIDFASEILGHEFSALILKFDRMRKTRNRFTYEEPGLLVTETDALNAIGSAREFVAQIIKYLENKNPQKKLV